MTSQILGPSNDPVICVEPILSTTQHGSYQRAHQIVVVQKSGRITALTSDLQEVYWRTALEPSGEVAGGSSQADNDVLVSAFVGNATTCDKSFLNYHPDIAAQLSVSSSISKPHLDQVLLVGLVVHSSQKTPDDTHEGRLQIHAVHPPTTTPDRRTKCHRLATFTLPDDEQFPKAADTAYRFDMKLGLLIKTGGSQVLIYDFLQHSPAILFRYTCNTGDIQSCVPINRSTCFLSTSAECLLMDLRYESIQARRRATPDPKPEPSRKRKRTEQTPSTIPCSSAHYFGKISIIAGINMDLLARCPISVQNACTSKTGRSSSRLVDALGRGDINTMGERHKGHSKALFRLREVFQWANKSSSANRRHEPSICIRSVTHSQFSRLVAEGCITPSWIQQALAPHSGEAGRADTVTARDIVESLAEYDPTIMLVSELVFQSPSLGLPMLTEALRQLLRSFGIQESTSETRLLQDVTNLTNGDLEHELQVEEDDAAKEIELASEMLESGLSVRTSAIRGCFEKLATCFHLSQVSLSLKSRLTTSELLMTIDVLRIEMRRGGWASRNVDMESKATFDGSQSHVICAISNLLNCAIDALGTGSLLANRQISGTGGMESYVASLRAETSAILEGVQESSFFDGFLRDFLQYESILNNTMLSRFSKGRRLHEEASEMYLQGLVEPAALPISTKSIERISATKVTRGGEMTKRSAQEIGHKISERVGPYTFERIRF